MKSKKSCSFFVILSLLYFAAGAGAWNCEVELTGPGIIKEGQTITFSAQGAPEGGSYSWSKTKNLEAHGSFALLTANEAPEFSDYIPVIVTYTSPRGKKCSDKKYVWFCRCYTKISGPDKYTIGDPPIQLSASQDPSGGVLTWTPADGLTPNGSSALFESGTPGETVLEVSYTPPGEVDPCMDTHTVKVMEKCDVSISGDTLVRQGETITITAEGVPAGGVYEWPAIPEVMPEGDQTAYFTGMVPGPIEVEVLYSPPEETEGCPATHDVTVLEPCLITIDGPDSVINVGETVTLTAQGSPGGGNYYWQSIAGLENNGQSADFTASSPGTYLLTVTYRPDDGGTLCVSETFYLSVIQQCNVHISGPDEVYIGDEIQLHASISGEVDISRSGIGTFRWLDVDGLNAQGSSARFMRHYAGFARISVEYTPPGSSTPCPIVWHDVTVKEKCSVIISGPSEAYRGKPIRLSAFGSHGEGEYSWSDMPGLAPFGSMADFTGQMPGVYTIQVFYESYGGYGGYGGYADGYGGYDGENEGETVSCPGNHVVTVKDFEVVSITGPSCVKTGTKLEKNDFQIQTHPPGFEDQVVVTPLTFNNWSSQSKPVIVTASNSGEAPTSTATKIVNVINSSNKTTHGLSFEIPNYIKTPLEKIGLAEAVDFNMAYNFKQFYECCTVSGKSTSGSLGVSLNVKPLDGITLYGIPIPPKLKKYIALDAINGSLTGAGNVVISGDYKFCDDKTDWSGNGDLTLGVQLASLVKAKFPDVIIIEGEVSGSASVTEKLVVNTAELKITPSWGGLTAAGKVTVKVIDWGIPELSGTISKTFFEADNLAPVIIKLPSLK